MNFKELIHNLDQDITKYNLFDERSMDNRNRDIFMKVSFIIFLILLIGKIVHLLFLKFKVCN